MSGGQSPAVPMAISEPVTGSNLSQQSADSSGPEAQPLTVGEMITGRLLTVRSPLLAICILQTRIACLAYVNAQTAAQDLIFAWAPQVIRPQCPPKFPPTGQTPQAPCFVDLHIAFHSGCTD